MSKAGIYKYNPETGKVEKVSDRTRGIPTQVWFPKTGSYYSESLGRSFDSKEEKRRFMKEKGIAEAG